ncbi:mandelate racemase/muconate lactonizing enzyme family protein [uncultured Jatrophihabitans sp.]|uniref:mandelate racemase/muconate lactonizing enzyme family protein n=1 Tax=uncultured Jatrophihabitans sp. TaxID=1610747 RepID=UPI0035CBEE64
MKITRVQVYEYDVAYAYGPYGMSHGRVALAQTSLVVRLSTDDGLEGWAETCPNGRTYLPSFLEGERAALGVLADAVLGCDPRNVNVLDAVMDDALLGSNAAKGVVDMAAWDILGQAARLPVSEVLGGRTQDSFPLFIAAPIDSAEATREAVARELANGIRVIQVKVGDAVADDVARVRVVLEAAGPDCTIIADANGGWNLQSALLAARQLDGLPVRLEQPCRTMTDCAELRKHTSLPLVLDECVVTIDDLMRAKYFVGAGAVNIKPSRVGGFTRARAMRDAAQGLGMTFTIDDTWGGALTTAQNAHLAASSRPDNLTATSFFAEWTEPLIATGPRMLPDGRGVVSDLPGLGVTVDVDRLGAPVMDRGTRR